MMSDTRYTWFLETIAKHVAQAARAIESSKHFARVIGDNETAILEAKRAAAHAHRAQVLRDRLTQALTQEAAVGVSAFFAGANA